jgi:hypothetical protein
MSGQRIAVVIGLAALALLLAALGVMNLMAPDHCGLGFGPTANLFDSGCSPNQAAHAAGGALLVFAMGSAIGALVTWASRPR